MNTILFLLVAMFGVFVQSLAGFGGTLLSMPLCILLLGLDVSKPVLTFMAWLTGASVLITDYKYINWRELAKMTAVMLAGVLFGLWATGRVELHFLLIVYAVVVVCVGVKKLFFPSSKAASKVVQNIALAGAGLMQGLFVSGGSFLAVYSTAQLPEKREFRATVNAVWGILNLIMVVTYFVQGAVTKRIAILAAVAIVPTIAAIYLGGLLARRVKQATFLNVIYLILIVSGLVLLITNL